MTIGDNVKAIRSEKKLTQEVLAKQMGISRSYLSDIENNRKNPSSKTIESLAEKLGVSMFYLTTGKKAMTDLDDDEKEKAFQNVKDTLSIHQDNMKHDLKKDIEQLLNSEFSFVETIYLSNLLTFLKRSNEEDIKTLASIIRMLNSSLEIDKDDDIEQDELFSFIEGETKEFKEFLKQRFHYKEGD